MCFRFEQELEDLNSFLGVLRRVFDEIAIQEGVHGGANIALTDSAMVVVQRKELQLRNMRFGLWPHWKKTPPTFDMNLGNARGDTIDKLKSFKEPFERRRCLIPATGFYEWRLDPGEKKKTPYKFTTEEPIFFFAGIWDYWAPEQLASFAIITTEPNALAAQVHDRMPVILPREDHDAWLDPENKDLVELKKMLQPYPPDEMAYQAYDRYVSNSKNKDKHLIRAAGNVVKLK
jgi:putative SOS response-associated peptidase YedK